MRIFWIALVSVAALGASAAAQDTPPPGCRWQDGGATLACKDGKGYWRRSGDGEIVGRYAVAKPKPKPAPKPVAEAAPAPPVYAPPPAPQTPQPSAVAATEPALAEQANADTAEVLPAAAESPPPDAAEEPPAAPPQTWWRKILDSLWAGVLALLRMVGLAR